MRSGYRRAEVRGNGRLASAGCVPRGNTGAAESQPRRVVKVGRVRLGREGKSGKFHSGANPSGRSKTERIGPDESIDAIPPVSGRLGQPGRRYGCAEGADSRRR